MTKGIAHQNPLNVKNNPNDEWKGSIGSDEDGHAIFIDPIYSVRAGTRILARKWEVGKRNLYQICESYAPEADGGHPMEYAKFVAERISLLPHHIYEIGLLNFFRDDRRINNWVQLQRTFHAMAEFENFTNYDLCTHTIQSGMAFYEYDLTQGVFN
jgi:hypothetical protein